MDTRLVPMDSPGQQLALDLLKAGQVIAFPTDTVYGLAADGLNEGAIAQLFLVKERPTFKAIPLLLADSEDAPPLAEEWPPAAERLGARFWPGPLTIVVKAAKHVPKALRPAADTIALRVPDQAWLRGLIRRLGHPLATTSANRSGGPEALTAQEVVAQIGGRIPLVVDGGSLHLRGGRPSSVVDVTRVPPEVLREGLLARAEIESLLSSAP